MTKLEHWQLEQRQGQPLDIKEQLTANRIKAYYERLNGKVYVSFSAAKTQRYCCTKSGVFTQMFPLFS